MAHISCSVRMIEKVIELLNDRDPELHLYVYRVVGGQRLKPALFHGHPFPGLFSYLRDRRQTLSRQTRQQDVDTG